MNKRFPNVIATITTSYYWGTIASTASYI